MVDDPDLSLRLAKARSDQIFEDCLRHVFGERHSDFSPRLRRDLYRLWELGLSLGPLHCSQYDGRLGPGGFGRFPPEEVPPAEEASSAGKTPPAEETLPAGKTPPADAPHSPASKRYPATTGKMVPPMCPPSDRDCSRPPCSFCGGTGMGDYPFPCNRCGGNGNG